MESVVLCCDKVAMWCEAPLACRGHKLPLLLYLYTFTDQGGDHVRVDIAIPKDVVADLQVCHLIYPRRPSCSADGYR